jgi:hypothetical protein
MFILQKYAILSCSRYVQITLQKRSMNANELEEFEENECEHNYEDGFCTLCGDVYEPDDFTGATEGDR